MSLEVQVNELPTNETMNLTTDEAVEFAVQLIQAKNGPEAAEAMLRAVLRIEPGHIRAHEFLGVLMDDRGRMDEALEEIEEAIALGEDDPSRWNNYGNILVGAGLPQRAREAFEKAIALDPTMPHPYSNLGTVMNLMGDLDGAETTLKKAIEIDPKHHIAWHNLGKVYFKMGDRKRGIEAHLHATTIMPEHVYRNALGQAFAQLGDLDEARRIYERWHAEEPDNPIPMQHLKAILNEAPGRCSDAYVKQVFDSFANSFEAKLKVLEYRAPELVQQAFEAVCEAPAAQYDILDAGCGTGWCAKDLKPFAANLVGVDLSTGMLERAAKLNLYDDLYEGELTAFLEERPAAYDRIIVCDTFCYFGDMVPAAKAAFAALRPGGTLTATFEAIVDAADDTTFSLEVSGRYKHAGPYIEAAFRDAGFEIVENRCDWLREEFAEKVDGWILTVRKPA